MTWSIGNLPSDTVGNTSVWRKTPEDGNSIMLFNLPWDLAIAISEAMNVREQTIRESVCEKSPQTDRRHKIDDQFCFYCSRAEDVIAAEGLKHVRSARRAARRNW